MADEGRWLGIDAGGTRTRWAIVDGAGRVIAEGEAAGMSAHDASGAGGGALRAGLSDIARAVAAFPLAGAHAAMTGLGDHADLVRQLVARALGLAEATVTVGTDIEALCRDLFTPGEGYVVYAGTGSIAAFLDGHGQLHRAGGRGVGLDDGGGGYWIAREALRLIWRREDEQPGAWHRSALARAVFEQLGDTTWSRSRDFFYGSSRGEVGALALAVARVADHDEDARAILQAAGGELARLARALVGRFGPRPVALAGRAARLSAIIESTVRASLGEEAPLTLRESSPHHAAARLARRAHAGDNRPAP